MKTRLMIRTATRAGKTFLKDCYFSQPFRVANVSEDRRDPWLYLVIMSSSPGVLNLDQYNIEIELEEHSKLQLQSQGYQRLFTMAASAGIEQRIHLCKGALLSYVPHPVVPHTGSDLTTQTIIQADEGAALIFGEVLTCGRKLSGESFAYSQYRNCLQIYLGSRLMFKDNVILQPKSTDLQGIGQFEGYTHQAGFVYMNSNVALTDQLLDEMLSIARHENVSVGISRMHNHLVILRILGSSGELLYSLLKALEHYIRNLPTGAAVETIPNILYEPSSNR